MQKAPRSFINAGVSLLSYIPLINPGFSEYGVAFKYGKMWKLLRHESIPETQDLTAI